MSENTGILLETKDLSKYFTAKKGLLNRNPSVVKAVDHVSLSVRKGETLGLVRLRKIHSGKNYSPPDSGNRGPGYVQWGRYPYL